MTTGRINQVSIVSPSAAIHFGHAAGWVRDARCRGTTQEDRKACPVRGLSRGYVSPAFETGNLQADEKPATDRGRFQLPPLSFSEDGPP